MKKQIIWAYKAWPFGFILASATLSLTAIVDLVAWTLWAPKGWLAIWATYALCLCHSFWKDRKRADTT